PAGRPGWRRGGEQGGERETGEHGRTTIVLRGPRPVHAPAGRSSWNRTAQAFRHTYPTLSGPPAPVEALPRPAISSCLRRWLPACAPAKPGPPAAARPTPPRRRLAGWRWPR